MICQKKTLRLYRRSLITVRSNYYYSEAKSPYKEYKRNRYPDYANRETITFTFPIVGDNTYLRYWVFSENGATWYGDFLPFLFHRNMYCIKGINIRKGLWK